VTSEASDANSSLEDDEGGSTFLGSFLGAFFFFSESFCEAGFAEKPRPARGDSASDSALLSASRLDEDFLNGNEGIAHLLGLKRHLRRMHLSKEVGVTNKEKSGNRT
jgi:hypothetical protein